MTTPAHRMRPIVLADGAFTLTSTGVKVKGRPELAEFQGALAFVTATNEASGWWLVDMIAYADKRKDWKQHIDAIIDSELLSAASVQTYRWMDKKIKARDPEVGFAQHQEVATFDEPAEQKVWLEKTKEHNWTARELREEIRASKRVKVIAGQAKLQGRYRVILADPAWPYTDSAALRDGGHGKAERRYKTMTMDEIIALPVEAHATPDAVLFLWVPVPLLFENPGPREVVEAWGFTYKTHRVWDKVLGNPGHYGLQVTHELLIIATRGNGMPDVPLPHEPTIFRERRGDEHSGKPESIRQWIDARWPKGKRLELFAREQHDGWVSFGNDPRLWQQQA